MLPQRDLLDAEALEAGVDGRAQVLRRAVGRPVPAVGADVAALGREHDAVTHAQLVEQRGDEELVLALRRRAVVAGAVGVGGVEERDAGVQRRGDGVEELLARLGAGLVEGHQAEADGADPVGSEGSCLHVVDSTTRAGGRLHPQGRRARSVLPSV